MVIAHNISALNTFKSLNIAGNASNKSMEKLSSGYKINRAGDDAAGLSISEKMRAQIRGLNQASTNAEHGVSMIQTAEGALNEEHSILQRMRELAVQSATDTNAEEDRDALQGEFEQLTDEINRIGNTTEFNGMKILNGDKAQKINGATKNSISVAFSGGTASEVLGEWSFKASDIGLAAASIAGNDEKHTFSIGSTSYTTAGESANDLVDAINNTAGSDYTAKLDPADNTKVIITQKNGATLGAAPAIKDAAHGVAGSTDITANTIQDGKAGVAGRGTNELAAEEFVRNFDKDGYTAEIDPADNTKVIITSVKEFAKQDELDADFTKMKADFATIPSMTVKGDTIAIADEDPAATTANGVIGEEEDNTVYFHVGANSNQVINCSFNDMRAKALGISFDHAIAGKTMDEKTINDGTKTEAEEYALNISTRAGANSAIESLDKAIKKVSEERSKYGAVQNRLEYTMNNLNTTSENMSAAESTIRDVDMAKEMMALTKNNILQQAAQSMLTQGMQRPQQALQLLQG